MSAADLTLSDLAHRPIWVGWREEMREGRKKKVPFDPTTGGLAKSDKPTTWSTRGEAEYWAVNERGGVGIMFTLLDNKYIAGIDLDTCRDPATGQIEPRAQEVIDRFASYTEVSPSGTGVKIFFLIPTTELPAIEGLFEGKHGRSFKNGGGEHCPAIEVYRGRRYFTVTDEEISPSSTLREVSIEDLRWLLLEAGPAFDSKCKAEHQAGNDASRSAKAFRKGVSMTGSYASMRDALLNDEDPEIAEWARTKGMANGEREMRRIFEKREDPTDHQDAQPQPIIAKAYAYREPKTIPPRQWLHAGHYIREFLSVTIAPGGLGKSSLQLVEAMGMAIGRDLLKVTISPRRLKVWYWNLEDPRDEIDRRIAAILLHYKIDPADIEGRLFINSEEPLVIATKVKDTTVVAEPVVNDLTSEIRRLEIDVVVVDPFVSCHKVPENDNNAIDAVAKTWAGIARTCSCSVGLAHHIRKPSSGSTAEITEDDARGASSLKDAGRSVRVLNRMSKDEADSVGIKPDQRKRYFRVEAGKTNMKPPAENIEWRKLASVPLDNGTATAEGDWVGVVTGWKMPGALEGVTASDLLLVQKTIREGKWREDSRAQAWVGKAVADAINLDTREPSGKKRIAGMLKIWLSTGALKVVDGEDERRHKRAFVEVGEWAV